MANITDDNGHNQIFKPSRTMTLRTARRTDWILKHILTTPGIRILEIGCATGEMAREIALKTGQVVVGVDKCKSFIEVAQKRPPISNLSYVHGDFNDSATINTLFNHQQFNIIYGNGILHHLYYQFPHALERIQALLKPEGKIVFLEPNLLNPYCFLFFQIPFLRKLARLEPDEMAFTRRYISSQLTATGYSDIQIEYRDFLIPGLPFILANPVCVISSLIEKMPIGRQLSQSLFISARIT